MSKSKEKHTRITHQATSAPNRLPALSEAIGPSVRGFMLCIAARACACAPQPIRLRPSACPSVTRGGEENVKRLVETDGLAHGRLDVKRLDVLPVLLEERHKEVDAYEYE